MDELNSLEELENIQLDTPATSSSRKSPWFSWRIRRVSFTAMSGNFTHRHRIKLYSPREESFTIPLKYIDVSRTTRTNLDVKQKKRIDDYWNVDGSRDLSDYWTSFTDSVEKPPDEYMWSGEGLTRKQLTSRPDCLWPELWTKLRNAMLIGICFIDPEDKERKRPSRMLPRNGKHLWLPLSWFIQKRSDQNLRVFWKPVNLKDCVWENLDPNHHEVPITGRGDSSLQHCNLTLPMPQDMKITAAKAAADKEWEKLEKISAWNLTKAQKFFHFIDEHMSFKECWIGDKAPQIQRSSCSPGWCCERQLWFLCSIH